MSRLHLDLLELIEKLIAEIKMEEPIYSSVAHIETNSIIEYLSLTMGYSPQSFAMYTNEGITFNVEQVKRVKETITMRKQELIDVANLSVYA